MPARLRYAFGSGNSRHLTVGRVRRGPGPAYLHSIHGLLIESEIPLDAHRVQGRPRGRQVSYRIESGAPREVPREPPPGRLLSEFRIDDAAFWATEDEDNPSVRILRYAGLCEATLDRSRRSIVVHSSPGADPAMLSIIVGGGVLAHAVAAEGRLVLHASAVETGGRALAVAGPSGTGKSTLAAILCADGARLISDDALRCEGSADGAICFPGNRAIRLRPGAASLARGIEGAEVRETVDARTAAVPAHVTSEPIELAAVIVPLPSREARALEVDRLGAMDGLVELLRHPRLIGWRAADQIGRLFEATTTVARSVTVLRATIPWGPPFPPNLARELVAAAGLEAEATPRHGDRTPSPRGVDEA